MSKWTEVYQTIINNDYLTIEKMKIIGNCGKPTAIKYRKKVFEHCVKNNIKLPNNQIPTELFIEVGLKKDMKYFETKLNQEMKLKKALTVES